MRRCPVAGLAASLLVHGALVGGVLLVVQRADPVRPIFIDLTEEPSGGTKQPAGDVRSPARAPAVTPASALPPRRDGRTARVLARPATPPLAPARPALDLTAAAEPMAAVTPPLDRPASSEPVVGSTAPPASVGPAPVPPAEPSSSQPIAPAPTVDTRTPAWDGMLLAAAGGPAGDSRLRVGAGGGADLGVEHADGGGGATGLNSRDAEGEGAGAPATQGLAYALPGGGAAEPGATYAPYLARLRERIYEALRYPPTARRRGLTGTVTIELTVLPDGAIGPVHVVESSAHPLLDEAAVESVRGLRRQPFPRDLPARTLRVRLPVVFELR